MKQYKPTNKIFQMCAATDTLCNFSNYKVCMTCGDKLWKTKILKKYDPMTGKPEYIYWFACNTVCKEMDKWLKRPWLFQLFSLKPWHHLGCEDFGG